MRKQLTIVERRQIDGLKKNLKDKDKKLPKKQPTQH
jgi:hypothetical protein